MEHESVQLWEGGPYWATTNIGAESPEDPGAFFAWGETVGYKFLDGEWVGDDGVVRNEGFRAKPGAEVQKLLDKGVIDGHGTLSAHHDAAYVLWGKDWRMPTKLEFDMLLACCEWKSVHGGYVVSGLGSSIFLPAAGYGSETSLYHAGSLGYYWSSVPYSDSNYYSWSLYFSSSYRYTYYYGNHRYLGQSVRPVQGFAE